MEIRDIYLYIYIWYVRPHFSSAVPVLCNVGVVKCQPFENIVTIGNGH